MEIERSFSSRRKASLTPLIDMVFLLVVFFMLSTTFANDEGISLNFASGNNSSGDGTRKSITVTVEEGGIVDLDGKKYSRNKFREALREVIVKNKKKKIFIKSQGDATVQDVISALDQVQLAGGSDITFLKD